MSASSHTTTHNDDIFVPPQRNLREDVKAKAYKMNRSSPNLAIIFDMIYNYNSRATKDMQCLKGFLSDSWNFNVVHVKVNYNDLQGNTGILKHWLARVFTERSIMREDDDYVFVGFFYESNIQMSSEALWDGMVTEDSFMFTRPKILFFQEYEYIAPQTDAPCSDGNCLPTNGARSYDMEEVLEPSHLDIISIHGFGYDYVKKFVEVAKQDLEMEICDLLTKVQKKFLSDRSENCADIHPYYISTLRRHLHLTNISNDQVDNASNMNAIQTLIKIEVPEANLRAAWESKYKSLHQRFNNLKQSAVQRSTWKDDFNYIGDDVKLTQRHVLLRRAHTRHENLNDWFEPEYQRIDKELQDLQQILRT